MKAVVLLLVVLSIWISVCESAQIANLPDYNGPNLTQFSGYLNVNQQGQRNLFYWLIEAEVNPDTAPLVVWFQGGPGCSSLFGLFLENGPYLLQTDGTVGYRDLSWTKYANMLWIEAPADVGFSYSSVPYTATDASTAEDNYAFLQAFMNMYPQYNGRDLWVAGESYAGVYVPTLTYLILNDSSTSLYQQMTGMMVGNPVFGCESLYSSGKNIELQFNYFYWHGLVSFSNYQNWTMNSCDGNPTQDVCTDIFNNAYNAIGVMYQQLKTQDVQQLPSLDPDDLYQDFCIGNGTLQFALESPTNCNPTGNQLQTYLNRADVQAAINANPTDWTVCSNTLSYSSSGASMIPYYEAFMNNKPSIKVLVYSGDVDTATVPFVFTQQCVSELPGSVVRTWEPWYVNGWTAGYVVEYEKFTYATVKGAGHEVPTYQPMSGIAMFSRFLQNGNLNDNVARSTKDETSKDRKAAIINNLLQTAPFKKHLTQSQMLRHYGIRG